MLERDLLLNASAAILLSALAWQHPAARRRWGRAGLAVCAAGALLPFLDTALFHLITADRIELISRAPLFAAPLIALALIAALAVLVGSVLGPRAGLGLALGLAAGFSAHVALAMLTPVGWPLLAPFSPRHVSLPILPAGHLPLLVGLLALLALAEGVARWRRGIASVAAALAVGYLLVGALQWGVVVWRAQALAGPHRHVHVAPDGAWLDSWQIVVEDGASYDLQRVRVAGPPPPEPRTIPRWNDEALFLKLLGDPVVSRFYFRVFQHPVVRLDVSGAQITLLMQELEDQSPLVPGPTFYLESDLTGRKRFYQLQRFN